MFSHEPLLATAILFAAALIAFGASNSARAISPVVDADYYDSGTPSPAKVALGRMLFFDKLLSGNRNIACSTCHHPTRGSGDALPLSLGEGAQGLAEKRHVTQDAPVLGRVPRNAQPLYNLGAREFSRLYHDGRVAVDSGRTWKSGFWSPAREELPEGLDNVLAAQAMFPVLSPIEMAGHKGENEIASAVAQRRFASDDGAWTLLAARLQNVDAYVALFKNAFPDITSRDDISFVHAANAIAAFEASAFRADNSPFDQYLRTRNSTVLNDDAQRGMLLFYGKAGCARCHSGKFQTDQAFHAIAMPQFGPGKGDGTDHGYWRESGYGARLEDQGRYRETRDPRERFHFRTPSLRNVELTAPYGHAGSYDSLEAVVRHHLDPLTALEAQAYSTPSLPALRHVVAPVGRGSTLMFETINPSRFSEFNARDTFVMRSEKLRGAIAAANQLAAIPLSDGSISDLVAFLRALTDPSSRGAQHLVPERVPSGLPVAD